MYSNLSYYLENKILVNFFNCSFIDNIKYINFVTLMSQINEIYFVHVGLLG